MLCAYLALRIDHGAAEAGRVPIEEYASEYADADETLSAPKTGSESVDHNTNLLFSNDNKLLATSASSTGGIGIISTLYQRLTTTVSAYERTLIQLKDHGGVGACLLFLISWFWIAKIKILRSATRKTTEVCDTHLFAVLDLLHCVCVGPVCLAYVYGLYTHKLVLITITLSLSRALVAFCGFALGHTGLQQLSAYAFLPECVDYRARCRKLSRERDAWR